MSLVSVRMLSAPLSLSALGVDDFNSKTARLKIAPNAPCHSQKLIERLRLFQEPRAFLLENLQQS